MGEGWRMQASRDGMGRWAMTKNAGMQIRDGRMRTRASICIVTAALMVSVYVCYMRTAPATEPIPAPGCYPRTCRAGGWHGDADAETPLAPCPSLRLRANGYCEQLVSQCVARMSHSRKRAQRANAIGL